MNKSELVASVAQKTQIDAKASNRVLNATLESIQEALARGDKVRITGFGTFEVKKRSPRQARNPHTGDIINMISGRKQSFHVATIVNRAASAMPGTEIEPMITADTALRPGKRNFVKA